MHFLKYNQLTCFQNWNYFTWKITTLPKAIAWQMAVANWWSKVQNINQVFNPCVLCPLRQKFRRNMWELTLSPRTRTLNFLESLASREILLGVQWAGKFIYCKKQQLIIMGLTEVSMEVNLQKKNGSSCNFATVLCCLGGILWKKISGPWVSLQYSTRSF